MEVLETYQELIEANADGISIWWKWWPMLFYFLSAISGYGAAILFYILWHDIFAENCPLWAEIISPMQQRLMPDNIPIAVIPAAASRDWRRKILIAFKYESRCKVYYFVSLCSCFCGVAWLILFAMCGKGGYDTRTFVAPWRVVPPALIFQFIFTIMTMFVVNDLEYGYSKFITNLHKISSHFNDTELAMRKSQCDFVQYFFEIYGMKKHNVCKIYPALQALSWIMACSWLFGLIVLTLRVLSVNDFKLLTVTIYKIPKDEIHKYSKKSESNDGLEVIQH